MKTNVKLFAIVVLAGITTKAVMHYGRRLPLIRDIRR